MGITLGLDLGIKTGSIVQAEINEEYNAIERYRTLVSWTNGPSVKDSLESIIEFFEREILPYIDFDFGEVIAIDWNQREIYWAANKAHSNVKTFVSGYIMCHCHRRGMIPRFIPPADVRSFLGFANQKTPKEEVQRRFLTHVPFILNLKPNHITKYKGIDSKTEHDLDALILAYIIDLQMRANKW
jgi:hypothetical protein